MHFSLLRFFILCSFFPPFVTTAQYSYTDYDTYAGLSQASNYFMLKDSKGYLWVSSADGLNRFDGRRFQNYYYSPLDSHSVFGSNINNFIEQGNGCLYIATTKGLCYYDAVTNKFTAIDIFKRKNISETDVYLLSKVSDTLLVFDDLNGLYTIDTRNNTLIDIDTKISVPKQYFGIFTIAYFQKSKFLFFATKEGLTKYTRNEKKILSMGFEELHYKNSPIKKIYSLACINDSIVSLGTNNGLYYMNIYTTALVKHLSLPDKLKNFVYAMKPDEHGTLWIGSNDNAIYRATADTIQKAKFKFKSDNFKIKDVSAFYFTPENIFVNEDTKGLGIISRRKSYVSSHTVKNNPLFQNTSANTYCFAEDTSHVICIGKRDDGILIYNPATEKFTDFTAICKSRLPSSQIKTFLADKQKIYIGTKNGICKYNSITKELTQYNFPKAYIDNNESHWCNHIIKRSDGTVLAGTRDGIFIINDSTNTLEPIQQRKFFAYYLYENTKHQLLTTGLASNLEVYEFKNNTMQLAGSYLKQFSILGIWQNKTRDEYWFACKEGIVHTDNKYEILHYFNSTNGLRCNTFYGIQPDGLNNIWCPSNKGIVTINLTTNTPYYYFSDNELSGLEYNGKGFFRAGNGKLYFGGETGFDIIDPAITLQKNKSRYSIQVEELLINDKKVTDGRYIQLDKGLISLPHNENTISLKINAVNCESPFNPKIVYKIDGFQNDWLEMNTGEWLRLPKLNPGSYTIQLKLSEQLLCERRTIRLKIRPAFYQTIFFEIFILLVIVGFAYYLYSLKIRQLKRIINIRQKISTDLHDDIGSTLSTINMYSQVAQLHGTGHVPIMHNIQENAQEVLEKLDDIVWATNPKNDQVKNLVERIDAFARPLLQAKGIQFVFNAEEHVSSYKIGEATRQNLFLICKEAINNVAKYAECKVCTVSLYKKGKFIHCTITDDGKGFDATQPTERNGLMNMKLRAAAVKGKLEIISSIGNGTSIKVEMPL